MALDIEITQGSTFELLIPILDENGAPLDMSGYTGGTAGVRAMIRKRTADAAPSATFDCSILNKTGIQNKIAISEFHCSSSDLSSLYDDSFGSCYLLLRLTATVTAALPVGKYKIWDVEIEDTYGFVFKPETGIVIVFPEATR